MLSKAIIMGLWLGTVCLRPAGAAQPAERFAGQIQQYREAATSARESLARLLAELKETPVFSKLDAPLITTNVEAVAQTWTEAATALEKGEEAVAAALARRAQELAGPRDRWLERIRWRTRQAQRGEYMPASAEVFCPLCTDRGEEDARELEGLMEAKKRRSEAYGRLAEATTPSADAQRLFQLQDEVFAADVEVGVAEMRVPWGEEDWGFRRFLATDRTITSPELTAAKQRLEEWRRQRETAYRQSRHQQHALEKLDREYAALVTAREKAYQAAKAAQPAAQREPRPAPPIREATPEVAVPNATVPLGPVPQDPGLPSPWQQTDIGIVKEPGRARQDQSVCTVRGAGWGIWGAKDSFHFVYQPLAGDGDVVARLGGLPTEEDLFVAGLTMRENLGAGCAQASVILSLESKARMTCRPLDGSAESAPPAGTKPYEWVRLVRAGDLFSGFCSSDGQTWVLVGTVRVKMSATVLVGLACAATLNHAVVGTTFDHVAVAAQPMGPAQGVGLVDGSVLAGRVKSLDGQVLKYTDEAGLEQSVPAETVAYLFTRPLPPDVRKSLIERPEGVSLVTGDAIEGSVQGLRDGRVTVTSLVLGQQTPQLPKVMTVVLRPVKAKP